MVPLYIEDISCVSHIHTSGIFFIENTYSPNCRVLVIVDHRTTSPDRPHIAHLTIMFTLLPPVSVLRQNRSVSETVSQANSSPTPTITVSTVYASVFLAPHDFQVHHDRRGMHPAY